MTEDPVTFLESARIDWRRDWDAVLVGFVVGVLTTLVAVYAH